MGVDALSNFPTNMDENAFQRVHTLATLRICVRLFPKIKAPGMADMPGESQEEPSVMVIAIVATIR